MDVAWAVDFGGTSIKSGLLDASGRLLARRSFPTSRAVNMAAWLAEMDGVLGALCAEAKPDSPKITGIGMGIPGFVDFDSGFVHELPNVPGWVRLPMRELVSQHFKLPVVVDNDANAMALGEMRYGAGRGRRHAVFITLGTGVGGGLYLNGQIHRGAFSMGGEIGHMSVDWQGSRTPLGRGALESYLGNRVFAQHAAEAIRAGRTSMISDLCGGRLEEITPKHISDAADRGDALALECFERMAAILGSALASLTYLLQPETFVVGGGVAEAGAKLFDPLRRELVSRLRPQFADRVEVRPAALGSDAGLIGAGALWWVHGGHVGAGVASPHPM